MARENSSATIADAEPAAEAVTSVASSQAVYRVQSALRQMFLALYLKSDCRGRPKFCFNFRETIAAVYSVGPSCECFMHTLQATSLYQTLTPACPQDLPFFTHTYTLGRGHRCHLRKTSQPIKVGQKTSAFACANWSIQCAASLRVYTIVFVCLVRLPHMHEHTYKNLDLGIRTNYLSLGKNAEHVSSVHAFTRLFVRASIIVHKTLFG